MTQVTQISNLFQAKLLVELVNTAACIDQLLLSRKERVTLGADFNLDILFGRTSLDDLAACTSDSGLLVVWMDSFFHCLLTSFTHFVSMKHFTIPLQKKQDIFLIPQQNSKARDN